MALSNPLTVFDGPLPNPSTAVAVPLPLGKGGKGRLEAEILSTFYIMQGDFLNRKHNPKLTTLARNLRKNMTKEEKRLWYEFLKDYPVRF